MLVLTAEMRDIVPTDTQCLSTLAGGVYATINGEYIAFPNTTTVIDGTYLLEERQCEVVGDAVLCLPLQPTGAPTKAFTGVGSHWYYAPPEFLNYPLTSFTANPFMVSYSDLGMTVPAQSIVFLYGPWDQALINSTGAPLAISYWSTYGQIITPVIYGLLPFSAIAELIVSGHSIYTLTLK